MTTTVYYYVAKERREFQLDFVEWGNHSLVVKYPPGTKRAGQQWRIGQKRLRKLVGVGLLRIEGPRPEWAQTTKED